MKKINVAIIGTGNIGIDLLYKVLNSDYLNCNLFAGRRESSEGIAIARERGVPTSTDSINEIINNPKSFDIVFDATSAAVHKTNAAILNRLGIFTIDMTPAKVGKLCIPVINGDECLSIKNINLITCGGQAIVPIAYAISNVEPNIKYIETVSTIASKSAGIGTRNNVDEFTQTTRDALSIFTGVKSSKAIIVMNPANPPISMKTTIYALIDAPNMDEIRKSVKDMEKRMSKYVPGYSIILGPIFENGRVTTTIQVLGKGDYLPEYAGNLDIITCAGVEMAERYARTLC